MTQKEALQLLLSVPEDLRAKNYMVNMRPNKTCFVGFYNMTGTEAVALKVYLENNNINFEMIEFNPLAEKDGKLDEKLFSYNIILDGNNQA